VVAVFSGFSFLLLLRGSKGKGSRGESEGIMSDD
jgi:hypothetical protein